MGAALMTRDEMGAVFRAAVARLREGRRNVYQSYSRADRLRAELDGRTLPSASIFSPEFRGPETVAEFFDDRIIEWGKMPGDPVAPVLLAIADAAREDLEAAVRMVKTARQLDKRAQWTAYQNLLKWKQGSRSANATAAAERIVNTVLGEWSRLHLAEGNPDDDE